MKIVAWLKVFAFLGNNIVIKMLFLRSHFTWTTEKGAIYFLLWIPHLKPQGAPTEAPRVRLLKGGEKKNHTSARRAVWGRAEWSTHSGTPGAYSRGEGGEVTLSGTPGDLAWRTGKKKPCSKTPGVWWSSPLFQFFPGKPGGRFLQVISVSPRHSVEFNVPYGAQLKLIWAKPCLLNI